MNGELDDVGKFVGFLQDVAGFFIFEDRILRTTRHLLNRSDVRGS